VENERVVRHHQIVAATYCLGYHRLGGIGAQQCARRLGIGVAHLHAGIVPLLLQPQGGKLLNQVG